ncbi:hypothetical protein BD626DRAFT_551011 [Schizophyllum amplum]|uniref:Protein kinase domain-containing protein n=1 Tax=Schizophyllum amplum TaxID=97359 RepID=A0A550BYE8_9AGAR|nr:hypothetical protein BD626DRAFT_551011 [Auriculariopsis ampla]
MLAAATSFFARTNVSQNYNIGTGLSSTAGSRTGSPAPGARSPGSGPSTPFAPSVFIGLWKVQSATHKVTSKRVSVWSFDKRGAEMERLGPVAKDRALEVLKQRCASALSKFRHPSILEMVEPLEETRNELTFATEPIICSLDSAIPGAGRHAPLVELDEIEIQKGVLQICKGLSFLHSSAKLIHSNINPESVIINSAGDWKISGLGLTIPLLSGDGNPTRWEFPTFDGRVPAYIQRSFDYMAPEYALDEQLLTASDMYSLGCLLYASTRYRSAHPSTLPTMPFFNSLPISTLNFLDRTNFTTKTREEKISFMKGLTSVLDRFSEGLRTRKILPSLLEEMKDTHLLPYILPNVFAIANALTPIQFGNLVLPSLKPLFAVKEPPQNMLTLLENLKLLQEKTEKKVFRTQVLPLVYNALDSEHTVVQERALAVVPDLCETIDYAEIQGVMFPRVALVFTKTRVLSVKVATLATFLVMVKTLDQTSLTQKLVPLLSKIRTKEPAVMMATLSVQEAMGFKVDREAVATLVLPQLWAMSMGPMLNVQQFQRFMSVIRQLGDRVESEHNQFLRDSQRIEDRSATQTNGTVVPVATNMDFESLVGRANGTAASSTATTTSNGTGEANNKSWDDDVWGSIFADSTSKTPSATPSIPSTPAHTTSPSQSAMASPTLHARPEVQHRPSKLGAKPINVSPFNFPSPSSPVTSHTPMSFSAPPLQPTMTGASSHSTSSYTMTSSSKPQAPTQQPSYTGPNYNISLSSTPFGGSASTMTPMQPTSPAAPSLPAFNNPPLYAPPVSATPPPGMGSILTPSRPAQPTWNAQKPPSKDAWGDFDPLA